MLEDQWLNSMLRLISGDEKLNCINGVRVVDCTKGKSVLYRMEFWVSDEKFKQEVEDILKSELFSLNKYILMYRTPFKYERKYLNTKCNVYKEMSHLYLIKWKKLEKILKIIV